MTLAKGTSLAVLMEHLLLLFFFLLMLLLKGVPCHRLPLQIHGQRLPRLQRANPQDGPRGPVLLSAGFLPVRYSRVHSDIALPPDGEARPRVPFQTA